MAPVVCGVALCWLGAIVVPGQEISRDGKNSVTGNPYPIIPGAVTKAPDWIGAEAPFKVAELFAVVPQDQNAAPLYLDAFFEFDSEVAVCFPAGPERDRRSEAAQAHMGRHTPLYQRLRVDPQSVPSQEIDEVIKLYDVGFRKLAEAQRRDRCVFETGLGPSASRPHLQAARQVARISSLRVRRATERQDFDAAIREVEMVLRLVRDLQPRGAIITQLVASAITQVTCTDIIATILAAPGLRVEHCDRLLKLLLGHEATLGNAYIEGLRAEYVTSRTAFRDLDRNPFNLFKALGDNIGKANAKAVPKPNPGRPDGSRTTPKDADAPIAKHALSAAPRGMRAVNDYYRTLLSLDDLPYAERLTKVAEVRADGGDPAVSTLLNLLGPAVGAFAQGTGRQTASLRATECLIIMRRWELSHRGLPRALTVAMKESGLKAIPIDPYDGKAIGGWNPTQELRFPAIPRDARLFLEDCLVSGGGSRSWTRPPPALMTCFVPAPAPDRIPAPLVPRRGRYRIMQRQRSQSRTPFRLGGARRSRKDSMRPGKASGVWRILPHGAGRAAKTRIPNWRPISAPSWDPIRTPIRNSSRRGGTPTCRRLRCATP